MRCAISVDLDEIPIYHSLHGIASPEGRGRNAVYDVALSRIKAFARAHHLPLTLFAVAADMTRAENAPRLREMSELGHEIGNHSLDHLAGLATRSVADQRRQVREAADILTAATGQRPVGFRSPGYAMSDELADVLLQAGVLYDSSVFPCAPYYLTRALTLGLMRVAGRRSTSRVGPVRILAAPSKPYHLGRPFWKRGDGILELPLQVTRRFGLPYIGTVLTMLGPWGARAITRDVVGAPFVNLELHGIDLLDTDDGLEGLASFQLDVRISVERKLESLSCAVEALRHAGYEFVRLREVAAAHARGARPEHDSDPAPSR